tara:strand:+ start:469 stop:1053 length:585 start_codon:yes stop_codon:yes gene_type:complete
MSNIYHLEKNVLTQEECETLATHFEENSQDDYREGYKHSGILLYDILAGEVPAPIAPIKRALRLANSVFTNNYKFTYNRFELKRLFGNIMSTGSVNMPHDDDGDVYEGKKDVEEHYSCILMLNSDYEGGELYFEHHGVEVRLEAGDLIMFRGNAENLHGVREVKSGKRVNVIIFFRNFELNQDYDEDIWKEFIA